MSNVEKAREKWAQRRGRPPKASGPALRPTHQRVLKLQQENPEWSAETISVQLQDEGIALSKTMVYRIVKASPITLQLKKAYKDDQARQIVEAYQEGLSVELVAERFNRTYRTIRKTLQEASVELRRSKIAEDVFVERAQLIREWRSEGYTQAECAEDLNISKSTVQWMERNMEKWKEAGRI